MDISIERGDCISCGICAATCPEVFRIADDGLAEVWQQPGAAQEDVAKEAAENCPVSIIYVDR